MICERSSVLSVVGPSFTPLVGADVPFFSQDEEANLRPSACGRRRLDVRLLEVVCGCDAEARRRERDEKFHGSATSRARFDRVSLLTVVVNMNMNGSWPI